jgi:murein L,D-transpeptidase YafK
MIFFNSKSYASLPSVDKIVVIKSKKIMLLLRDGEVLKVYKVSLGKNNGPKVQEGDKRTPEGTYRVVSRNQKSKFYLSLMLSYPNEDDIERAKRLGVSPGNGIAIHGLPEDMSDLGIVHRLMNWTDGCIAVTNKEMDEIWRLVPDGTIVEIRH